MQPRVRILMDNHELLKQWQVVGIYESTLNNMLMQDKQNTDDFKYLKSEYEKEVLSLQHKIESHLRIYQYYDPHTKKPFDIEDQSYEHAAKQVGSLNCKLISITKL